MKLGPLWTAYEAASAMVRGIEEEIREFASQEHYMRTVAIGPFKGDKAKREGLRRKRDIARAREILAAVRFAESKEAEED